PKFTTAGGATDDSIVNESSGRIGINNPTNLWLPYQTLRLDNPSITGSAFTLAATFPDSRYYSFLSTGPAALTGGGALAIYDEGMGAYRFVIDRNGRVGIGTFAPTNQLEVRTTSNGAAMFGYCTNTGQGCKAFWGQATSGNFSGYFAGGYGVEVFTNDAGANALWGRAYGQQSMGVLGQSDTLYGGWFKSQNNAEY